MDYAAKRGGYRAKNEEELNVVLLDERVPKLVASFGL